MHCAGKLLRGLPSSPEGEAQGRALLPSIIVGLIAFATEPRAPLGDPNGHAHVGHHGHEHDNAQVDVEGNLTSARKGDPQRILLSCES